MGIGGWHEHRAHRMALLQAMLHVDNLYLRSCSSFSSKTQRARAGERENGTLMATEGAESEPLIVAARRVPPNWRLQCTLCKGFERERGM